MYKGIYAEKKTFSKFDNEHYLCYLNEQREEYSPEPDARSGEVTEPVSAPILGYAYTGSMADGGTLIEARIFFWVDPHEVLGQPGGGNPVKPYDSLCQSGA